MSIPSSKWFPTNLQDRAGWYGNFNTNIPSVATSLGVTTPDLTSLSEDASNMGFMAEAALIIESYADAIRSYRRVITEGDIGDPTPVFPTDITFSLPFVVDTGMFERLDNLVKRIRVSPAYTDEIGALLGIIPSGGPLGPIDEVPPVIKASVDPGNIVEVKFVKGQSDGIYIETNVDDGGWAFAKMAIKSPAVFDVPSSNGGTPRGVQIRGRFLDGNNPVGDWSQIETVQTIP